MQPSELTIDEAVALLVARHELTERVKQAAIPDLSPYIQRVLTPGADDALGQAARGGLIGAGVGGLAGAGSALFGDRRRSMLQRTLTGALLGGGLGAAAPTAISGARAAFKLPPSVVQHENEQAQRYGELDAHAQPGFQPHATAGLTAPADETARQIEGRVNASDYASAAGSGAGLLGHAAAQGAAGYSTGLGINALRRRVGLNAAIPSLMGDKTPSGTVGSHIKDNDLYEAIGAGARPNRPAAGYSKTPSSTQWNAIRQQALRARKFGRGVPGTLGAAAAAAPLIESLTGQRIDPGGWLLRAYRGATAPAGQQ